MEKIHRNPELLGRHAPEPNKIIFKEKEPPIIVKRNVRVDIIFVYLLENILEIVAIEIKTGSIPQIGKGLSQLKHIGRDFIDGWFEWLTKKNLFKRLIPFSDYELYLSLILLEEKFTKPIEEWASYKKRFKIADIRRQDNYF